jgi:hypothetical protein
MEATNNLAPIVLFCYNRPWHTQQTLDALSLNDLAAASDLIVYCDGPKINSDRTTLDAIEETRKVIKLEKRFHSLTIIESDKNKGLADSIIEGVTEIVNKHGKIIVLEDDIVTSPGFLQYMNDALNVYENEEKVMHISGYMFPVKNNLPETFFIRPTTCWGWGTWKRAWECFEKEVDKQIDKITNAKLWNKFTLNESYPSYKSQLYLNQKGEINTWAIFWQTTVFLKEGYSLHPYPSLVQNIGLDGSGIHCESNSNFNPYYWENLASSIDVEEIKVKIDRKVNKQLEFYFNSITKTRNLSLRDKFYLLRKRFF